MRSGLLRRAGGAVAGVAAAVAVVAFGPSPTSAEAATVPPIWAERPDGFGAGATGGEGGDVAWVTTTADDGPGSLRALAEAPGARRIGFRVSGTIALSRTLLVAADKTIDGRGAAVTIARRGFVLREPNVIVRNLTFRDIGPEDTQDAINIDGAHDVWIDHNSFTAAGDKLIGIPRGTDVTISWNRFFDQTKAIQIGTFATQAESRLARVTLHHNLFDRTGFRNPRVSYGVVHAYSNWLRGWSTHGMSAVRGAQLLSQQNIFEATGNRAAVIFSGGDPDKDATPGFVRSEGDVAVNGARVKVNGSALVLPSPPDAPSLEPVGPGLVVRLATFAGVIFAPPPF